MAETKLLPLDQVKELLTESAFVLPESGRTLIHTFSGSIGADWDLAEAIDYASKKGAQAYWAWNLFKHNLVIEADGRRIAFDVENKEET